MWAEWITKFLNIAMTENKMEIKRLDVFTSTSNWQWSQEDEIAEMIFESIRKKEIEHLPDNFFGSRPVSI